MAKSIMIQGTMSNAGKSILAGGLCRIFVQDGYRTAPFKSQNMALNSYITDEGLEMGRAQVMQAEAAKIRPSVKMNPILLKPSSDTGSQVIVNGEVLGQMSAAEYYRHKTDYIPAILDAYQSLSDGYDMIVIEGAGSPAEINLKENDIVNMGLAKMVDAPVLLVGDIDRGGVFAQIVGTIELLEPEERDRIAGIVINKFRGDKKILEPGLKMLEEKTEKPVFGVIPYFHLDIDEEDSLSERLDGTKKAALLDIAVIRFPRLSNYTDLMALECMDEVSVRYVSTPGELGEPDAVILPGSKNTVEDLLWMRQNGLEAKIQRHAEHGKLVFGICGGYQMLGEELIGREVPDEAEAPDRETNHGAGTVSSESVRGMGLLPVRTIFRKEKTRTRVRGRFSGASGLLAGLNGTALEGYEIHMGDTEYTADGAPLLLLESELDDGSDGSAPKPDGAARGSVYGCYVHGVFDHPEVSGEVVRALLLQKGMDADQVHAPDMHSYKEEQYDKLADIIRENLDMKAIYQLMGCGNGRLAECNDCGQ